MNLSLYFKGDVDEIPFTMSWAQDMSIKNRGHFALKRKTYHEREDPVRIGIRLLMKTCKVVALKRKTYHEREDPVRIGTRLLMKTCKVVGLKKIKTLIK